MNGRSLCVRTGCGPFTRRPRQRNQRRRTRARYGMNPGGPCRPLDLAPLPGQTVPGAAGRKRGGTSLRHPRAGAGVPPVHDAGRILGGTSLRQPRAGDGDPGRDPAGLCPLRGPPKPIPERRPPPERDPLPQSLPGRPGDPGERAPLFAPGRGRPEDLVRAPGPEPERALARDGRNAGAPAAFGRNRLREPPGSPARAPPRAPERPGMRERDDGSRIPLGRGGRIPRGRPPRPMPRGTRRPRGRPGIRPPRSPGGSPRSPGGRPPDLRRRTPRTRKNSAAPPAATAARMPTDFQPMTCPRPPSATATAQAPIPALLARWSRDPDGGGDDGRTLTMSLDASWEVGGGGGDDHGGAGRALALDGRGERVLAGGTARVDQRLGLTAVVVLGAEDGRHDAQ